MAAVGLTWEEAKKLCPEGVYAACHNSDDSVTISGPRKDVEIFVEQLKEKNIFAKAVDSFGYSFHSKYIEPALKNLRKVALNIIKNPKRRSARWLSTGYREDQQDDPNCQFAGLEYFMHNLISPVLFNEATKKIPRDAILIEIGPHHLLQAILKRSMGPEAVNIGIMKRNEPDNLKYFFEAIGKLYTEGVDPKIEKLYPSVKFPVPRNTPRISDLIKWNHTVSFDVKKWHPNTGEIARQYNFDGEDQYLLDHFIDGRSLFPATGYLVFAWEMLAKKLQKNFKEFPIMIENFKIHRATVITQNGNLKLKFNLLQDSKHFEIYEGHSMVASGQIYEWKNTKFLEENPIYTCDRENVVEGADLYSELRMTGYEYGPEFQRLVEMNLDGSQGLVSWTGQWPSFLDALLLFFGIVTDSQQFHLPTGALSIKIDPSILYQYLETCGGETKGMPVNYNPDTQICRSVGVEIVKLMMDLAPHRIKQSNPTFEEYRFLPYISRYILEKESNESLKQYMYTCNEVINKIAEAEGITVNGYKFPIEAANDTKYETYTGDLSESHCLLKCLSEIANNPKTPKNQLKDLCSSHLSDLGRDFLNTAMADGFVLKVMLEIIAENTFKKLNITEIHHREAAVILPNILRMERKYPNLRYKSGTLITEDKSKVDHELINSHGIHLCTTDMIPKLCAEKNQDVVVSSFISGSTNELQELIQTLTSIIHQHGFIVFYHKEKFGPVENFLNKFVGEIWQIQSRLILEKLFRENKLTVISTVFDSFGSAVYLLRPTAPVLPYKVVKVADDNSFSWVKELQIHLASSEKYLIWLVAENEPSNGLIGMVNCLKQEPGGERIRSVFMSPNKGETKPPPFSFDQSFYKSLLIKNMMYNVWKDGTWGSFRHVLIKNEKLPKKVEHSYVNCKKYGDLSSFEWVESQVKYADMNSKILVHIYYSAMNFKDVMIATGKLSVGAFGRHHGSDESVLGLEFSGRDLTGRRVAGITPSRGMATACAVNPILSFDVPEEWTLAEAATVPVVYCTCYYALVLRAHIRQGQSILIHSATGGIGIAATHIALSYDCEVFATVGNDEKRKYLRKMFPQIKDENIGCSRDVKFETMIMKRTKGRGVDIVLNSLADEKFQASVRCVARHGQFLEIGKYDLSLDRNLGLKTFLRNISFHAVMLDQLFDDTPANNEEFRRITDLVRAGIQRGVVKPLPLTMFEKDQIEEAFRYMSKGIHVGKVVLKIRDEEPQKNVLPETLHLSAIPNTYFYSNKSYIVVGGLGGFGIEVTKWILERGGRNIILTTRKGARIPYHNMCLKRWKNAGFNVHQRILNAANPREAEQLLKEAAKIAPVGGIFNSAVVLRDGFFDCQTVESYKESCESKAVATKILDELSRVLCPYLDYFICFSSISCGRGNAGQTNYGYANSVMERICEQRRDDGLHGLAIQWGIIGDVGLVHRNMGEDALIAGVCAQNVKSCLNALDLFCQTNYPVLSTYVTAKENRKVIKKLDVVSQIAKVLGMKEISEVSGNKPFGELGIDSLMGVEIKQLIESQLDISITIQELHELKINDIRELANNSAETSESKPTEATFSISPSTFTLPKELFSKKPICSLNSAKEGVPVFIVTIGNMDVSHFQILAQNIDLPVFVLSQTKTTPLTDVKTLITSYLKLIKSITEGCFHLIGYSSGGFVAFHLALQEEKNLKSITLLDGSKSLLRSLDKEYDSVRREASTLSEFMNQFSSEDILELEDELLKATNFEERVKTVVDILLKSSESTCKTELSKAVADYATLSELIQSHKPIRKLSKEILLVEDPLKVLPNDVSEIQSSFSQLCSGKVIIQRLFSRKDLWNKSVLKGLVELLKEKFS